MRSFALKAAGLVKRFRKDEDGAMTVEWVAIAAAVVVGAVVAITWAVLDSLQPVAADISELAEHGLDRSARQSLRAIIYGPPDARA